MMKKETLSLHLIHFSYRKINRLEFDFDWRKQKNLNTDDNVIKKRIRNRRLEKSKSQN